MESFTVNARWTLENWRKHHKILVDKKERFVVNVPSLGNFQFFIYRGENRSTRENNVFQGYNLRVTVPCVHEKHLSVKLKATAAHLPELSDNSTVYNNFEIDLKTANGRDGTETFISPRFMEGRLGRTCGSLEISYTDPREYKAADGVDMLDFHMADTVFVHFQIRLNAVEQEMKGTAKIETYTKQLYFSDKKSGNVGLVMNDGVEIPAHSFMLLANREMLDNILPLNSLAAGKTTIPIPGISSDVMNPILEFVYTGQLRTVENFSELLDTVHKYSLKPLLQYLSNTNLNIGSAADLYGLCHKYNLQKEKSSISSYVQRHSYQFLEKLCIKNISKGFQHKSVSLKKLTKVQRFEKITSTSYDSVKATKTWPPRRCHLRSQEDAFCITLGDNLVTFCFYIKSEGLYLKFVQPSQEFRERHLLVDVAAQLKLDRVGISQTNASREVRLRTNGPVEGFLLFASQGKFGNEHLDKEVLLFLDPKFSEQWHDQVTEIEFSVDIEVLLRKEETRQKPETSEIVDLKMNDGHCLPVCKHQLAANNSVFQALFFGGLKESGENVIRIPDLGSIAMLVIVEFVCSGQIHPAWTQNPAEVTLGASKYMLAGLMNFLDSHISQLCSTDNFLDLYGLARMYGLARAEDEIAEFVVKNADEVLQSLIPKESLTLLKKSRCLKRPLLSDST